ncbi:MAG: hypothetical protein AB1391_04750 [Candidatus Micrarchaeota archaeon]
MENKNILTVVSLVFVLLFGCTGTEQKQPPKEVLPDLEDFVAINVMNIETGDEEGTLDTKGNIESIDETLKLLDDILIGKSETGVTEYIDYKEAETMERELSEVDSFNGDLEFDMTFEIDISDI